MTYIHFYESKTVAEPSGFRMALAEAYATTRVKDHMVTVEVRGTTAEEAAECEMNAARGALRTALKQALGIT